MAIKTRLEVEKEIDYVSQLAMNLTGNIRLEWKWQSDDDVVIFNAKDSEGCPADDNVECAELVAKLTGWEIYPITIAEEYDQYSGEPFKVGLRKPKVVKEDAPISIPENLTDLPVFTMPFETLKVTCDVEWDCDEEDKGNVPNRIYTLNIPYDTLYAIGALYCIDNERREILMDSLENYLTDELSSVSGWCHKSFRVIKMEECK